MFEIDSQEKIVLAKTYSIIGKYFRQVTSEIGYGEIILRCAGLSSLVDEYRSEMNPYYIKDGKYKNDNLCYNPVNACFDICKKIENNKQALGKFLKEIFDRAYQIEDSDYEMLKNYLEIIGYELVKEQIDDEYTYDRYKYS